MTPCRACSCQKAEVNRDVIAQIALVVLFLVLVVLIWAPILSAFGFSN